MLEIIYDTRLIEFPFHEGFTFFGVPAPAVGAEVSIEDFSTIHQTSEGPVVEYGPRIGHYHHGEAHGFRASHAHNCLEFIVPVNPDSDPYIEKLAEADGLHMQGHFFETLSAFTTGPNQHMEQGRFRIPPNHFYFLGEHTNVV